MKKIKSPTTSHEKKIHDLLWKKKHVHDNYKFICCFLISGNSENETFFLGGPKPWLSSSIIEICEKFSGQKAKLKFIPISLLKIISKFTTLFEWSLKVNERLAFIETLQQNDFSYNSFKLYEKIDIDINNFISLENYLQEYFEKILNTLKDLNYEQSFQQRNLKV